jgi:hypothetical protein
LPVIVGVSDATGGTKVQFLTCEPIVPELLSTIKEGFDFVKSQILTESVITPFAVLVEVPPMVIPPLPPMVLSLLKFLTI